MFNWLKNNNSISLETKNWFASHCDPFRKFDGKTIGTVENGGLRFTRNGDHIDPNFDSNVLVFEKPNISDPQYAEMQDHEMVYWRHTIHNKLNSKLKWEDYSKYNYHFDMNVVHLLKQYGYDCGVRGPFDCILDVGCGPFGMAQNFTTNTIKVGVDSLALDYTSLLPVDDRFPKVACAGESLPFNSGTFDLALSTNAIDHFQSWEKSIDEMIRCTCSNGLIFIDVDCRKPEECDEMHQMVMDPNDVLDYVRTAKLDIGYYQVGPKKYCSQRLIMFLHKT